MTKEIERKFIVDSQKWHPGDKKMNIRQGYLSTDPERTIRVRIVENSAFLTIKSKSTGITRDEFEYTIPVNEAEDLIKLAVSTPIIKTRYIIDLNGKKWEVDKFSGENDGLLIAEIEMKSESEEIILPDWILKEVTGDIRFYNSYLAIHPYSEWK